MNKTKALKSRTKGSVMALVLVAVVILLVVGGGLLTLEQHSRLLAVRTSSEIAARSAADAALTKALFEMNEKLKLTPWDDNTLPQAINEPLPNCDATFSCTVTSNPDYIYDVDVTGRAGQTTRKIHCTLILLGLFQNAIYAQDSLVLENGFLVDAYSSEDGPYGGANALQPTTVATDSNTVTLGQGTIYGEVLTDYGMDLPQILPPEGEPFDVSKGSITETTTISENGRYDYIDLTTGSKLTINGDVTLYVTGNAELRQSSELEILPDSSLTLYQGGDLLARNTTLINVLTQEPKKCQIYGVGTDQTFLFEQSSIFYGTIYAPDADVTLENSATLYGAVIANNAELNNSSELHYDATLARASIDDLGAKFVVQCWQEK